MEAVVVECVGIRLYGYLYNRMISRLNNSNVGLTDIGEKIRQKIHNVLQSGLAYRLEDLLLKKF